MLSVVTGLLLTGILRPLQAAHVPTPQESFGQDDNFEEVCVEEMQARRLTQIEYTQIGADKCRF